jgi:4,5-dihydroxyphthalate decarboxylase
MSALTTVTRTQGNNRALKDGIVRPKHAALRFEEVPVLVQAFRRMVRGLEFDVCEMAASTYLCAKAFGVRFTAIPVFLVRGFHHGAIVVDRDSTLAPKDLEGSAVGVNRGYTVTTGVWARSVLSREYAVDLSRVTWMPSGDEHVADYRPPTNVAPLMPDRDLLAMVGHELTAVVGVEAGSDSLKPLIDDPEEAGFRALAQRGHYPINHLVVVRDDRLDRDPDLAADLFHAFTESKARYVDQLLSGAIAEPTATDRMHRTVADMTGGDPLPYGIEPNRAVLTELVDALIEQQILDRRPDLDTLFADRTRDLVG